MKKMLQLIAAALTVLTVAVSCKSGAEDPFNGLIGSWQAVMVAGAPKITYDVRQPEITFREDGFVSGYTGLNNFDTRFSVDHEKNLTLNEVVSTKKAGTEPVMAFERLFMTGLQNTARFDVSGDTLTFFGADGSKVMTFKKKPAGQP